MRSSGKHCWVTYKCGHTLCVKTWRPIAKDIDYRFALARNPYSRLVSFYADKMLHIDGGHATRNGVSLDDYAGRSKVSKIAYLIYFKQVVEYHLNLNCDQVNNLTVDPLSRDQLDNLSFKLFCYMLNDEIIKSGDAHMRRQTDFSPTVLPYSPRGPEEDIPTGFYNPTGKTPPADFFNDIIWLEDLPECFQIPAEKLGVEIEMDNKKLLTKTAHKTTKLDSLNTTENAWDKPNAFWWQNGGFPTDYSIMYDDELKELVYNLYKDDFDYFGLEKGQFRK